MFTAVQISCLAATQTDNSHAQQQGLAAAAAAVLQHFKLHESLRERERRWQQSVYRSLGNTGGVTEYSVWLSLSKGDWLTCTGLVFVYTATTAVCCIEHHISSSSNQKLSMPFIQYCIQRPLKVCTTASSSRNMYRYTFAAVLIVRTAVGLLVGVVQRTSSCHVIVEQYRPGTAWQVLRMIIVSYSCMYTRYIYIIYIYRNIYMWKSKGAQSAHLEKYINVHLQQKTAAVLAVPRRSYTAVATQYILYITGWWEVMLMKEAAPDRSALRSVAKNRNKKLGITSRRQKQSHSYYIWHKYSSTAVTTSAVYPVWFLRFYWCSRAVAGPKSPKYEHYYFQHPNSHRCCCAGSR